MDHDIAPDRMAETLRNLCRYWEEKRRATAHQAGVTAVVPQALTITLSRQAGTQGTAIGHEVGARLDWPVYDHELLERIAQDLGIHSRLLESVDERRVNWLREAFAGLISTPYASQSVYVHRLIKTVLALGSHGECVIVGRGAAFVLPAATTLRVRVIAPLNDRVATISRLEDIPREQALRRLEALERERNTFVRSNFFDDPAELTNYDLVVDVARFGVSRCAEVIVAALNCLRDNTTDNSR
jgi:cytidylate kinase